MCFVYAQSKHQIFIIHTSVWNLVLFFKWYHPGFCWTHSVKITEMKVMFIIRCGIWSLIIVLGFFLYVLSLYSDDLFLINFGRKWCWNWTSMMKKTSRRSWKQSLLFQVFFLSKSHPFYSPSVFPITWVFCSK